MRRSSLLYHAWPCGGRHQTLSYWSDSSRRSWIQDHLICGFIVDCSSLMDLYRFMHGHQVVQPSRSWVCKDSYISNSVLVWSVKSIASTRISARLTLLDLLRRKNIHALCLPKTETCEYIFSTLVYCTFLQIHLYTVDLCSVTYNWLVIRKKKTYNWLVHQCSDL
jgi:hypothetical protein